MQIHSAVLKEHRLKIYDLSDNGNMSIDRVHNVVTVDQKWIRMNINQLCLDLFRSNKTVILRPVGRSGRELFDQRENS